VIRSQQTDERVLNHRKLWTACFFLIATTLWIPPRRKADYTEMPADIKQWQKLGSAYRAADAPRGTSEGDRKEADPDCEDSQGLRRGIGKQKRADTRNNAQIEVDPATTTHHNTKS